MLNFENEYLMRKDDVVATLRRTNDKHVKDIYIDATYRFHVAVWRMVIVRTFKCSFDMIRFVIYCLSE